MAGTDQSVNLSGMLGQIAETTGSMNKAFDPVLKAATKPRGDMSDPQHLRNLAQWASSNGDTAAAQSYMAEARRLAEQATADAKRLRAEQGSAAMGNIQKGMQDVLAQGGPDADRRMQALEQAAMTTAARDGMDGQAAAGMGNQARMNQMSMEAAERNKGIQERAVASAEIQDQLTAIRTGGGTREEQDRKIDIAIKRASTKPGGATAARAWQAADMQFSNEMREANEAMAKSGPLSDAEIATAEEYGISVEGNLPNAVRTSIRAVQVARASQKRDKAQAKPVEKAIIRELLPQAFSDMESNQPIMDTQLDDWLEDAVDDPELMDRVAAFIDAGGTVQKGPEAYNQLIEAIKDYVVATDSGKGWFGSAKEEILKERGVTSVTTSSGETVTIKKKKD